MQAAIYHQFGKAKEVIEVREVEKPEPQEGQIRVKLFCAGGSSYFVPESIRPISRCALERLGH
ncbi:MAG: hypothetical protein RIR83_1852 [Pseudomonadota bacterium]